MGREKWSSLSSVVRWTLVVVTAVAAVGGALVAFWGLYVVYPEFRASVWHLRGRVAAWVPMVVAIVCLVSLWYVVWRYWLRLWKLVKCAGGKLRDGYLWVLWRLVVRPARDYQGVEASNEAFDPGVKFTEELRPVLRELDDESLTLLGRALDRRKPGSREAFMEWPELRVEAGAVDFPEEVKRLDEACERLRDVGAIEMWVGGTNMSERLYDLRFRFPVTGWSALERLRVLVEVELARREMVEGAAAPVRDDVLLELSQKTDSPADGRLESGMKRLLASLDDDQLQVYETFLEQYLATLFPEQTRVRAADVGFRPVTSASHMDKRLHGACEELEAVGLLPDLTWGDTADGLHVDATVHSEMHGLEVRAILYMVREELRSRGIAPRRS